MHLLGRGCGRWGRQSGRSQPACAFRLRPNTIACIPPPGSSSRSRDACQAVACKSCRRIGLAGKIGRDAPRAAGLPPAGAPCHKAQSTTLLWSEGGFSAGGRLWSCGAGTLPAPAGPSRLVAGRTMGGAER
ncbi:hypothetical protein GGR00_001703 [Aminobacter aganoensis]|uniref:Uncharacterized protein n=1 Tax=Aminobacter aganoensis TaxID=83264 RepID=A0A7X0F6E3_9HYPH|nr:hypothetical protein [Aminobacter aganoensis]